MRKRQQLASALRFLRRSVQTWDQTANFLPSQRFLIQALVDAARAVEARTIVELGPGVGNVTEGLLRHMAPNARLFTVEIDPVMSRELARRVRDDRLHPIEGRAENIEALLAERGVDEVDVVVSTLGVSLLPTEVRDAMRDAAAAVVGPAGAFVQYANIHTRLAVYSTERGFSRFHYDPWLQERFAEVDRRAVPINFPPAYVYRATQPRQTFE